jgi:hypothetical protein
LLPTRCHTAAPETTPRVIIIIIIIIITTTNMPNPVYEEGDVTVLCNQAVHIDREVTTKR